MKKFLLTFQLIIFLLAVSCQQDRAQGYDITLKIRDCKDSIAYLGYNFGDQKFIKDTALMVNGDTFHFHNDTTHLTQGIYFLYSLGMYFEFIVNEPRFTLITDTADYVGDMKVIGSRENSVFNAYQKYMAARHEEGSKIGARIDSLQKAHDTTGMADLKEKIKTLSDQIEEYRNEVVENNPGTFVAKLVRATEKPNVPDPPNNDEGSLEGNKWQFYYYKNHFFDNFNMADSGLLRSPIYQPMVDEYMDKLTVQDPDSLDAAADYLLKLASPNKETFRYLLVKLTNKYESSNIMGMERVFIHLAENYYLNGKAFWADTSLIQKFRHRVDQLKPNQIGNIAPAMTLVDTLMHPVSLSDIHNRFIILYFYDHDCGHCKEETPILYDEYRKQLAGKDVAVWAADIMNNLRGPDDVQPSIKNWKGFIRVHHLNGWINVADPGYHDNFRAEYDVEVTPTIYILNSKKEIIAKRIGIEQIPDFIDRMIEMENKKTINAEKK